MGAMNGGSPFLYRSTNGGVHRRALARVPLPTGEGLSAPVVAGPRLAVTVEISGNPGATAIASSEQRQKLANTVGARPAPG
jgi:hypothetical protein